MPCSCTSSPPDSTSASTRMPHSLCIAKSAPKDVENENTPTAITPSACTPSWWNEPVYTRPPVPVASFEASAGTANSPVASVHHTPDIPCTATAPIGSSIPRPSTQITPNTAISPEPAPITIAAHGATNPEAAVIATRPPSAPFSIIEMSGLPSLTQATHMPVTAPAAAAMFVVVATYAKKPTPPKSTDSVEPGLKPNQPNQRISVPSTA